MADNLSTSSGISQRTNLYAEAQMLAHAGPQVVLDKWGLNKQMPKNKSVTIKFRRPIVFDAATSPITEGVTPTPTSFRYEDESVSLKQYGQVSTVTDVIEDTHEDPVLQDLTRQLGENIARTREALMWGVLRAGTSVTYANGAARSAVNTTISLSKQRSVVQALKRQKAKKITRMLDGSPNFKTTPIEASYVAVGHTDLEPDIRSLPGFIPVSQYGSKKMCCDYEIGSVEDVRYVLTADLNPFLSAGGSPGSTVISTDGSSADVYPVLFFGQEAYGTVALRGQGAIAPSIIPVGQKTKDDPLGQRGYAGWKMWFAALILNQAWMRRLEVAATQL